MRERERRFLIAAARKRTMSVPLLRGGGLSSATMAVAAGVVILLTAAARARADEASAATASASPPIEARVEAGRETGIVGRHARPSGGGPAPAPAGVLRTPDTWTLLLVAMGLLGGVFALRHSRRRMSARDASSAVQVLARTPLSSRQSLCLIRMGRAVLLLGVTPEHVQTLAEVRDPVEAAALVGAAESGRGGSLSGQFMEMLGSARQHFSGAAEPAGGLAAGEPAKETRRRVAGIANQIRGYVPQATP